MSDIRIHFVLAHWAQAAHEDFKKLKKRYGQAPFKKASHIVVLSGDGGLLKALHTELRFGFSRPVYGLHYGRVGFLMNPRLEAKDDLVRLLSNAHSTFFHPLRVMARSLTGKRSEGYAINEVAVLHANSTQIIRMKVTSGDPRCRYDDLSGDGVIVSSPIGSTGYNLSAGGPILLPTMDLLAVTPVCPMRLGAGNTVLPRKIRADAYVHIALKEADRRRAIVCRDHLPPFEETKSVTVRQAEKLLSLLHTKEPLISKYRKAMDGLQNG